jgi:hypothetical protein
MKFQVAKAGFIQGIRYYQSPGDKVAHIAAVTTIRLFTI